MATNSLARDPQTPDPPAPIESLTTLQPADAGTPLTALQLKARLDVIHGVMRDVMKKGIDYDTIPGTKKPTLLKPGAEKLCVTFRLAAGDPTIEELPAFSGAIRYRLHVPISASSGIVVAVGIGECSSDEEKYRWRRPVHGREFELAPVDERRIKVTSEGEEWKQVRVHPADVANTILKMSHKRAYIHATIMATAAGSIFAQDVEDLPPGMTGDAAADEDVDQRRGPIQPPQRKAGAVGQKISDGQAKRIYAIAMSAGWTKAQFAAWLKETYGVDSDRDLLRSDYDAAVRAVQGSSAPDREPGDEGLLR